MVNSIYGVVIFKVIKHIIKYLDVTIQYIL